MTSKEIEDLELMRQYAWSLVKHAHTKNHIESMIFYIGEMKKIEAQLEELNGTDQAIEKRRTCRDLEKSNA